MIKLYLAQTKLDMFNSALHFISWVFFMQLTVCYFTANQYFFFFTRLLFLKNDKCRSWTSKNVNLILDYPKQPSFSGKISLLVFFFSQSGVSGSSVVCLIPLMHQDCNELQHCFSLQATVTKAITVIFLYSQMHEFGSLVTSQKYTQTWTVSTKTVPIERRVHISSCYTFMFSLT